MMEAAAQSAEYKDNNYSLRPIRRAASGRFPIKVSSSATQLFDDGYVVPPLPKQPSSHRTQQNVNAQSRRSGAAASGTSNERLRSNSESILQATRAKRMGIVPRKNGDLAPLDEQNTVKPSHIRGLSHGSLMEDKGNRPGTHNAASPMSPLDIERSRDHYVRRLSSLPERRRDAARADPIVEAAKSVLYGLYQVHSQISSLIAVVRDGSSKRSSLERVFYNASTHVEELDREIQKYEARGEEDEATSRSNEAVKHACVTCVIAYHHVGTLLLQNTSRIASAGDQRYIRTLLLLIYSGVVEVRNGCRALPVTMQEKPSDTRMSSVPGTIRPRGTSKSSRQNDSTSRLRNGLNREHGLSLRSGSLSSTIVGTPMSSENFHVPQTPSSLSLVRMNSQTLDELDEEQEAFEKIFLSLKIATEAVLSSLPAIDDYFVKRIEYSKQTDSRADLNLWTILHQCCMSVIREAEEMKSRLVTIKIKEPSIRGQRSFWEMASAFVRGFVELALRIKNAKESQLIPIDVLQALRPVQRAVKEVGMLIETSPWRVYTRPSGPAAAPSNYGSSVQGGLVSSAQYFTPVPATPLSAALGAAAQATIPSTPSMNLSFSSSQGAYDRADSLHSLPARSLTTAITDSYSSMSGLGMTSTVLSPTGLRKETKPPVGG